MTPAKLAQAHLLAQVADLTYAIGTPGGAAHSPDFDRRVFLGEPHEVSDGKINAALAVETDEAFILGFRGTLPLNLSSLDGFVSSALDWMNDAECAFVNPQYAAGRVHAGFAQSLDAVWPQLLKFIQARNPNKPVWITGHSKGGGLATLAAARLRAKHQIQAHTIMTYGSPCAGDQIFAAEYNRNFARHFRFEHEDDIVPHLPPSSYLFKLLIKAVPQIAGITLRAYFHVGQLKFLDWNQRIKEGDGELLEMRREMHFGELAIWGELDQLGKDHSLGDYVSGLAELLSATAPKTSKPMSTLPFTGSLVNLLRTGLLPTGDTTSSPTILKKAS